MTPSAFLIALLLQAITVARINSVGGEVEIARATQSSIARTGDVVSDGDRLHTSKDASLALSTESGVTLQLKSDSRLEMKKVSGEVLAFLSEGGVNVVSSGKPVRVETRYGQIIATDDSQEFDVRYNGDAIQVFLIRGSVTAEASEPSKIVFKSAADLGTRVYEAGSISPTQPRSSSGTTVTVYPEVGGPPTRRSTPTVPRPPLPPR